jgi:hypothetical protein
MKRPADLPRISFRELRELQGPLARGEVDDLPTLAAVIEFSFKVESQILPMIDGLHPWIRKTGKQFKNAADILALLPLDRIEVDEAEQVRKTMAMLEDYAEWMLSPDAERMFAPVRKKGGRPKHKAFAKAIQLLADNFERQTGRQATISYNTLTDRYSGTFLSFVDAVLDMLPDDQARRMPKTRAARGKAVQLALAERRAAMEKTLTTEK